jgi:hypothetical protein
MGGERNAYSSHAPNVQIDGCYLQSFFNVFFLQDFINEIVFFGGP